jgi:hypothetical protein
VSSWVVASLYTLIKGDLFSFFLFRIIDLDLIIIFTALLVVFYGEIKVGLFIYAQGLLIDVLSGGVLGLYALIYLLVFAGIKLWSHLFDLQAPRGQFIIVILSVLLKGIISLVILYIFSWKIGVFKIQLLAIPTSAICSGITAYFTSYFIFHFKEGVFFYHEKDKILP